MGISINGYIEIRPAYLGNNVGWYGVVNLNAILGTRDYLMYHSLFGIRDDTDFAPIAPDRGLPDDVSKAVLASEPEEYYFGHTWVTYQELQAVNWEEEALTGLVEEYRNGVGTGHGWNLLSDDPRRIAGVDYEENGVVHKFLRITRRESLGDTGPRLYDLMEVLAKHYGAEHVRAVVWFD